MLLLKILEIPVSGFYKLLKTTENGLTLCHVQFHIFTIITYHTLGLC